MLRNSLKQMLVEGAPFEARHGKPCLGTAALLSRFQLAQDESTHTGIEVKMQLGLGARLTGTQRRKLLGISEEKLDLEACFVPTIKRLCIQVGIGLNRTACRWVRVSTTSTTRRLRRRCTWLRT